ncbi:low-density lipoprotein receptor-related protein 8-like [Mytilus californianus]|uniref:low-density lipoprotein receptor-related protein 8-like n=1 Tax=Mytilus californianus TaxID=6549 RepID=UPI0022456B12|nr:low-density lipoprotein receptor-related protein 8-like [Mytilus californianus]
MEIDVDTRNVTVLVGHGESFGVFSFDYDFKNGYVYFPRYNVRDIVRFPYPSQNITLQHVVTTSPKPTGIAVDSANDHVYWVYHYSNTLSRCKSDGTNVVVVSTSLSNTFMIRLDVTNRWMYIGYIDKGISKSRFDLTDISMIANFTSNIQVFCMDIDLTEQRLYWMNSDGDIKSVNLDGSDVKTIISTHFHSNEYDAMGLFGSYIFYADNNKQLIMRNKSKESAPTVLYTDTRDINSIYVFKTTGM